MCTVLKYKHRIGRNFDYEISYKEEIITIPKEKFNNKYSIIGVCTGTVKEYPLLYDGLNEYGLVCCGLAFTNNAKYNTYQEDHKNIPAFDFTFYILGHFKTVKEVKKFLKNVNIWCEPYSDEIQNTDLHWFIADKKESIIVEQTIDGLEVYDGEVLTNNPPYPLQIEEDIGNQYFIGDSCTNKKGKEYFTRGTETEMLDGGYTSSERFTRVSYLKKQLEKTDDNFNPLNETFHLLQSVEQIYGATPVNNSFEYTIYSVVYDMENIRLWIKTYDKLCPTNYMITPELERIPL